MPYTITWPAYTVPRGAVRFVLSAPLSFNLQWDVKVAQRVGELGMHVYWQHISDISVVMIAHM